MGFGFDEAAAGFFVLPGRPAAAGGLWLGAAQSGAGRLAHRPFVGWILCLARPAYGDQWSFSWLKQIIPPLGVSFTEFPLKKCWQIFLSNIYKSRESGVSDVGEL